METRSRWARVRRPDSTGRRRTWTAADIRSGRRYAGGLLAVGRVAVGLVAMGTLATGLTVVALAVPASAEPGEDNGLGPSRPVLECVSANGDGTYTAVFGTNNPSAVTDASPIGRANSFSPAPADRGQPTSIAPGRSVAVFSVVFDGNNLVWSLNGRTSTASAGSRPCGAALNVAEAPQVAALGLVVGGLVLFWFRRGRRTPDVGPAV